MRRILLLLFLLAMMSALPLAAQSSLRIQNAAAPIERVQGYRLVSAGALATLGARIQFDEWQARLLLYDDTITFFSHSPFLRIDGRTEQLVSPAIRTGNTLWLPLQFFTEWLPGRYPGRLAFQAGALRQIEAVASRPETARAGAARPERAEPTRVTRVVILDAGHGGRDPGKPGPNGLLEKNAALAVTNRLAGFLRERGYEVHLTRTRDTLIALDDRPHMANEWKNGRAASVFISIHANSGARSATGFETYFLSEARTEDERRVAEMENEAVQFETRKATSAAPELERILSDLKNDFYLRASNSFAEMIQSSIATVHPGPNRGVKQAGFRVLVGALMPAVLVEMGFISNASEARLLGTAAFQQKIAWSLAQAVDRFFKTHESLLSNAAGL